MTSMATITREKHAGQFMQLADHYLTLVRKYLQAIIRVTQFCSLTSQDALEQQVVEFKLGQTTLVLNPSINGINLGAQPNTHTLMKLNTVVQLHLAKKGNHPHTKQPSQNCVRKSQPLTYKQLKCCTE